MESDEALLNSQFSPNTTSVIRKLRKKLRQIEKLERLERTLTEEEEVKLDTKEELREELQNYLNQEENMVTLTEQIEKTTITHTKDVQFIETMGEEKLGYDANDKLIDEGICDEDEELSGNGDMDNDEDLLELKNGNVEVDDGVVDVKIASETIDDSVNEKKEEVVITNGAPTPCITRKSLRQRNRGCHTAVPPPQPDFSLPEEDAVPSPEKSTSSDAKDLFTDLTMAIKLLEGHFQDVCSVDLSGEYIVSAGRDTTVKLWSSACKEELKSLGGHTATVTSVKFMKDKSFASYPNAVSGSYDCSVRVWDLENGTQMRCIYVYSPVVCLDYTDGKVAIGTEGGKVEVYNVETGDQLLSLKTHEDAVSAVKLLPDDKVACGSTDGVLKIFNISIAQTDPVFALDPLKLSIKQACETDAEKLSKSSLSMSKITCITCWNGLVIYGDEGFNIKVLDYEKGEVTKVRNNLQEFCPTESLDVASVQGNDCLFSVGSDVDRGDAYINIRSLPDLKYFGTIRDIHRSTGTITTFSVEEIDTCIRLVTGGQQLRVWDQAPRRAKKRKSATEEECLIPCKFICNYTEPRESEPESESDESSLSKVNSSTEISSQSGTPQRWCSIL